MIKQTKPQSRFMVKSSLPRMQIFDSICMAYYLDRDDQINNLLYEFVKDNFYILNLDEDFIMPKIEKIFYPD